MTSSSSQTRISASSGRMSRRDAYDALRTISAVAGTFPTDPAAHGIARVASEHMSAMDDTQPGAIPFMPSKATLLHLQEDLNVLVTDRLYRSERATPDAHAATVVVLYGSASNDSARAFQVAAIHLQVPEAHLRLVDVSPVQTDRLSGSRWTIRTLLPHEDA